MTFQRFAWSALAYNIMVILWGAWVRITGSGAGCGSHWPTCHGEIIPKVEHVATVIEFGHRVTSGLTLIVSIVLVMWAWRLVPKGNPVRRCAAGTLFFILAEGALGAGLVLFELVGDNDSVARAVVICLHLANTFALLAFGTLTALLSAPNLPSFSPPSSRWKLSIGATGIGLLLIGATGAITALGDTLFPVNAAEQINGLDRAIRDFTSAEHFLVQLRIIHPIVSIAGAMGLLAIATFPPSAHQTPRTKRSTSILVTLVCTQIACGWLNIELNAPGWMQLVHLLLADLVWISFLAFATDQLISSVESDAVTDGATT